MKVSGKNMANRPFFFFDPQGKRVEFPSLGEGAGELEGAQLSAYQAQVKAGIIKSLIEEVTEDRDDEQGNDGGGTSGDDRAGEVRRKAEGQSPEAEYEALSGKKPDGRWSEERLLAEIAKLKG